jgi:hypothetical protein
MSLSILSPHSLHSPRSRQLSGSDGQGWVWPESSLSQAVDIPQSLLRPQSPGFY